MTMIRVNGSSFGGSSSRRQFQGSVLHVWCFVLAVGTVIEGLKKDLGSRGEWGFFSLGEEMPVETEDLQPESVMQAFWNGVILVCNN